MCAFLHEGVEVGAGVDEVARARRVLRAHGDGEAPLQVPDHEPDAGEAALREDPRLQHVAPLAGLGDLA